MSSVAVGTISVESLVTALQHHEAVTILDIRPNSERQEWRIPGSVHVDAYDALKAGESGALALYEPPADRPVVTVCGAGKTSLTAATQLRERGFEAVSLAGGMKAWSLAWNTAEIPLAVSDTEIVQIRRTGKGCLSYIVASRGEAVVVDPSLDSAVYQEVARQYGWSIAHVLETHVHADHLMRSRRLCQLTKATLHLPANDRVDFPYEPLLDGDLLDFGSSTIWVMRTPGHTGESSSYLIDGEAVLTGDTLFLNGVGRPDLEASPERAVAQAHQLHGSLRRLLTLPGETIVLPGHTNEPVAFDGLPLKATIGELRTGIALLREPENTFVETLMARIPPTPPNHHQIVALNEAGEFPDGDPAELEAGANRCAIS